LPYLLKIFGYVIGDGSLILTPRSAFIWFWGKSEDLEDIRGDIREIGYSPSKVYTRKRMAEITSRYGTKRFTSVERGFYVHSRSLAALLYAMGVPRGAKAAQAYDLPTHLFRLPLWMKRLFLAAFFGAEMSTPAPVTGHSKTLASPLLTQSKHLGVLKRGLKMMRQVKKLLAQLGVKCNPVTLDLDTNRTLDGITSSRIRLQISESPENLVRFWGTVGFEYNRKKTYLAAAAVNYIKTKRAAVLARTRVAASAVALRNLGAAPRIIYDHLSESGVNERFIERSIYSQRAGAPRISYPAPESERQAAGVSG
jgi:tRNA-splicing ligase RtcB